MRGRLEPWQAATRGEHLAKPLAVAGLTLRETPVPNNAMKLLPFALVTLTVSAFAAEKKNVLLLAGRPSHGAGEHEHNAGVQLLAKCLEQGAADSVAVKFHLNGEWPSAEEL